MAIDTYRRVGVQWIHSSFLLSPSETILTRTIRTLPWAAPSSALMICAQPSNQGERIPPYAHPTVRRGSQRR
jgi:hypothetical protein